MEELVVLCTEDGTPCGTHPKKDVHHTDTPLHLAFSCYVQDDQGRLLITRRALSKKTWPGVWTNSMCGHPAPDENNETALVRRGVQELGIAEGELFAITEVLDDFSYRAVDSSGIVEYEICPVYAATVTHPDQIAPLPEEVDSYHWVAVDDLVQAVRATPWAFSPWMVEQLADQRLVDYLRSAHLK